MVEAKDTIEYKGHTIEIKYDEDPQNPREDDNLTEIHCKNSRYYLGENQHQYDEDIDEVVRQAEKQGDFILKVFAYIHGGVCLSLESFYGKLPQGHAEFDSGQCGVLIIRREKFLAEFGGKKWTKKLKQRAYEIAKADIETFNAYLNGQVYGFVIDDGAGDSCWGFYDDEECLAEAKSAVDYAVQQEMHEHCQQLKKWIQHKVPLSARTPAFA